MKLQSLIWVGLLSLSCLVTDLARAQQDQKPQRIFGIVMGTDGTRLGFTVLDKAGVEQPVKLNPSTTFVNNKGEESTFDEVIRTGYFVRCALDETGGVTQVAARGPATQVLPGQLRALMRVTDEEWAVINPRIDHIRDLQRAAEGRGSDGGSTASEAVRSVWGELQTAVWDPHASSTKIEENLRTLRELRAQDGFGPGAT